MSDVDVCSQANDHNPNAVRALYQALKLVEWGARNVTEGGHWTDACPACGGVRGEGHIRGCPVAAALAQAEGCP